MPYQLIQTRTEADKVGIITLNRPQQLNALNDQLMDELGQAIKAWDADEAIGCMVITGSEKAFAAGADIAAMAQYSVAARYWQSQGYGHGADRSHDGRRRGRARRTGQPRGAPG